jgi:L-asparaginase
VLRTHVRRAAVTALLALAWSAAVHTDDLPHVHLIATGGTISNRSDGRLTHQELIQSVPGLTRIARLDSEQFSNVTSDALTPLEWLQLARRINDLFRGDRSLAGVVVTSGTDMLEETAYFLNLTVTDDRPVVFVGSMRNPGAIGYDGAANLLDGVRVAATPVARARGTLVVLNGQINAARDVSKSDAQRLDAFQAHGHGELGVVDADRVTFYRNVERRHTTRAEWDVGTFSSLPRVDILSVYQGAPADLIRAAVDFGARGIVIAGAGAGSISSSQQDGVAYAAQKGVFVVLSTRTGSGRVPVGKTDVASALSASLRPFIIAGEDLAPVKARILLMLALAKTDQPREIQRIFTEY